MAALERETEISEPHAAWRAGLPILTNDRVMLRELHSALAVDLPGALGEIVVNRARVVAYGDGAEFERRFHGVRR